MSKIVFLFLILTSVVNAQNYDTIKNSRYLEDQIYISLSVITLTNLSDDVAQSGFSNSFGVGFIKDIPVNAKRQFCFRNWIGLWSKHIFSKY